MVARPGAHIRKRLLLVLDEAHKLVLGDDAVVVVVDQVEDVADDLVSPGLGDVLVGVVHQAICAENLKSFPCAIAVEVVQSEEGGGVEVLDVVFLCSNARDRLAADGLAVRHGLTPGRTYQPCASPSTGRSRRQ